MAVQKNKRTRSTRGMRRAHDTLKKPAVSTDPQTGETHMRHHVGADGYYRGKKIVDTSVEDFEERFPGRVLKRHQQPALIDTGDTL